MIEEGDLIKRKIRVWQGKPWADNEVDQWTYLEETAIVLRVEGKISGDQMVQVLVLGETIPEWIIVKEHSIRIISKS